MKKLILFDNKRVRYQEFGPRGGITVLFLPGGGEELTTYSSLLELLAKSKLRVLAIDLIGFVEHSQEKISLKEWADLVDEFASRVIGNDKFVILAHSMGTLVTAQYFEFYRNPKCNGAIFFGPGLVNNPIQYLIMRMGFTTLRLLHCLPEGMKWMKNIISFRTCCILINNYGPIHRNVPCVVIVGKKDPFWLLHILTGWKRLNPTEVIFKGWDHSPQNPKRKNLTELATTARAIISKMTPSQ
jgi:pimeloyl-ACP methyl ester carboxylesterase